eukprot:1196216-Prorocentrum_minimum.AAC.2
MHVKPRPPELPWVDPQIPSDPLVDPLWTPSDPFRTPCGPPRGTRLPEVALSLALGLGQERGGLAKVRLQRLAQLCRRRLRLFHRRRVLRRQLRALRVQLLPPAPPPLSGEHWQLPPAALTFPAALRRMSEG